MDLKIWKVVLNDGGSLPTFYIVALSKEEAIEKSYRESKYDPNVWSGFASEFTIDGYVIQVFSEIDFQRLQKIDIIND